jgi:hypothetical protein
MTTNSYDAAAVISFFVTEVLIQAVKNKAREIRFDHESGMVQFVTDDELVNQYQPNEDLWPLMRNALCKTFLVDGPFENLSFQVDGSTAATFGMQFADDSENVVLSLEYRA